MSQHISYDTRRNAGQDEPIYIGFDEPQKKKPKKPSNLFGAASIFFGVVGLLCTGVAVSMILTFLRENYIIDRSYFGIRLLVPFAGILISALALFCAFIGIFKKPRRYAIIGGLLGFIPIAIFFGLDRHFDHLVNQRQARKTLQIEKQLTQDKIQKASDAIVAFQKEHQRWPEGLEGNRLVIPFKDSWNNELRYEKTEQGFLVRSAGPDGKFETSDDCKKNTNHVPTVLTSTNAK